MAAPSYYIENRYAFVVDLRPAMAVQVDYEVRSPENEFEWSVFEALAEANEYLHREEYRLALRAYKQLQWRILQTVHPELPPEPGTGSVLLSETVIQALIDPMIHHAAEILNLTREPRIELPPRIIGGDPLPPLVQQALDDLVDVGVTSGWKGEVDVDLGKAGGLFERGAYDAARLHLEHALGKVPASEKELQGALRRDLALVLQRSGDASGAVASAKDAVKLFAASGAVEHQAYTLAMLADSQGRAGDAAGAKASLASAAKLARKHGLDLGLTAAQPADPDGPTPVPVRPVPVRPVPVRPIPIPRRPVRPTPETRYGEAERTPTLAAAHLATLMSAGVLAGSTAPAKSLVLHGTDGDRVAVDLGVHAAENLTAFYQERIESEDLGLLGAGVPTYTQLVAYIPHIYFFVIPMAIGDCRLGMGDYSRARTSYLSVLPYAYINKKVEVPTLWMRLADVELEWGRHLYTSARDSGSYSGARSRYRKIIRRNGTVDTNSHLYKHTRLAPMRARVNAIGAAADPAALNENPAVIQRVLAARSFLDQIAGGLNFFGLANDYVPPFTFEHLYNLTRHFASQAQQAEQRYIQFKSQAENEEFRREQLAQQVELARSTVELEQLGWAEAHAGVNTATQSVDYAEQQRANAAAAETEFATVRWALLELTQLAAWAGAAAMDQDDEVLQTITGYTYYAASDRRRSLVVQDLSRLRTRITHDMEAARLARATQSAEAYKEVAQAQLAQAEARRDIAVKRVEIARVQERHANENLEFMDLKEFGERMWYELARDAKQLMRRYVDMATEVGFLMERAYDAETGRGLRIVKFDYGVPGLGDLTGAGALLVDADYFQLDYVRTSSKKAPVKEVISIGDTFPMAFQSLLDTGSCQFQTTLEHFDRAWPGQYLRKVRSVEIVFVGLSRVSGIHGTLRNVGVSEFRRADGTIDTLAYPADVMPLSAHEVRNDAVVFRVDPRMLRLFENNGVATLWQLELPRSSNDLDYRAIFDVQLVVYYDAFFDATLEAAVRAALPTSGAASRSLSMRIEAPDELFYLRNQGAAELSFDAGSFPRTQENLVRTQVALSASGAAAAGLTLRLTSSQGGGALTVSLDGDGAADSTAGPLATLVGGPVFDDWALEITAADNPGLAPGGELDLSGLEDLGVFFEYTFDYRS